MEKLLLVVVFYVSVVAGAQAQESEDIRPDFLQVQYAGSIGYISLGAGYHIMRKKALVSMQFGHVPNPVGGPLNILSGRFLWIPKQYSISQRLSFAPFNVGMMISYHMGSDFRTRWPSTRYPDNYYWWQTSFRLHPEYQPSLTLKLREYTVFKSVTAYLDVNTNELYLVSFAQNREAISAWDILALGVGIRLNY